MPITTDDDADSQAIERVLGGDADAFERIVERYQKPLLKMIMNFLDDREESRDVGQEVLVAAYRNLAAFDPARSRFSTWLFAIARNRSLNALRRRRRREGAAKPEPGSDQNVRSPREEAARREIFARLDAAVRRLPARLRTVFVFAEFEGLPYDEIAQLEGIKTGTVKSRVSRARARVRAEMKGSDI